MYVVPFLGQSNKSPFKDESGKIIAGKVTGTVSDFRKSSDNSRFHAGIDLKNTYNYSSNNSEKRRAVFSMHNGVIFINRRGDYWNDYIRIKQDDGTFIYYKHILPDSNNPFESEKQTPIYNGLRVEKGQFLGLMIARSSTTHLHINDNKTGLQLDGMTNMINNFLSPFNDNHPPDFMFPFDLNGSIAKNDVSNSIIEFRKNGHTYKYKSEPLELVTFIENIKYKVLYDKVDIICRLRDRHILPNGDPASGNNGVNSISYSVSNYNKNIYKEYKNINFNSVPKNNIANYIFDNRSILGSRGTDSRHVYIITNSNLNQPHDRYFNTRIRKNIVDNYSDSDENFANYSNDAELNDGLYNLEIKVEDIANFNNTSNNQNSSLQPILIDNFHPYIERTLYIYENSEFYRIFWEKKDENTLIKSGEYGNKKFKKGDKIKIAVRTSEPMKEMTVSIIGTSLIDLPMKARTIGKNSWEVDINYSCDNCNSEEKQLEFKGLDLNNNGLLNNVGDISEHLIDRSSSNKSALQKRNNSVGFDRNHKLNSDENCNITANAGINKTIQQGQNTQLEGRGGSSYSWSPSTGLSNPNIWNPIASPTQTTTYTLTVTENGCTDTDTVTITVNDGITNPPPNDDCGNAVTLTSNTSCNNTGGTVADATPSVGANTCEGCMCKSPDDYDVYYKFTAIETSHTVTRLSPYLELANRVILLSNTHNSR